MITANREIAVGELVLSFDLELGWGSIENGLWLPFQDSGVFRDVRPTLARLLSVMDECNVPATWGVVGCLIAEPGNRDLGHLPGTLKDAAAVALRSAAESTLDGRDLVEQVANANTAHAFCSHTYSHTRFGHPDVDRATIREELSRFRTTFPGHLPWVESLIFPLNQEAFHEQVVEDGFQLVRGKDGGISRSLLTKSLELVQCPPLSQKSEVYPGLHRVTDSMLFNSGRRSWKLPFVSRRARLGLERAVDQGGVFHVWTHPFDLAAEPDTLEALIALIRSAADLRDAGQLTVGLMSPTGS